jgi:cell division protein ZapB
MQRNEILHSLEAKIDQLVRAYAQLHEENRLLREENAALQAERSILLDKTNQARLRIEAMIARLKEMEEEV